MEAGELVQWLRAPVALPEDQHLIPHLHGGSQQSVTPAIETLTKATALRKRQPWETNTGLSYDLAAPLKKDTLKGPQTHLRDIPKHPCLPKHSLVPQANYKSSLGAYQQMKR